MKTSSEKMFEDYLNSCGISEFYYEPDIENTPKHPDYKVRFSNSDIFFEVKEFEPPTDILSGGFFDPYKPIRSKINDAQPQLRPIKGQMCGIVLASFHPLVSLEFMFIYGAMLGNIGFSMPFDAETATCDSEFVSNMFTTGGKMIQYRGGQAINSQNTTISAICVVKYINESSRLFNSKLKRKVGHGATIENIMKATFELLETSNDTPLIHTAIQVYENPYAVAPLDKFFGKGVWDERFGVLEDGSIGRLFVGSSLAALESEEKEAEIKII